MDIHMQVEQECGCIVTLYADGTSDRIRCAKHRASQDETEA